MVASSSSIRRCESVPSNSWIRRRRKRRYSRTSSGVRFRVSSFTMKYGAILYSTSPGPVLFTPGRERILAAGFPAPEVTFNQPVLARGENMRLLELSVAEAGPALVDAGLITAEELDRTLVEMRRLAADGAVLAVMPR